MAGRASPGIFTNDLIFTDYQVATVGTRPVIVGGASRGELSIPTEVVSIPDLIAKFGRPLADDYGLLAAVEFLSRGDQLVYLRVADSSVATASATVQGAIGAAAGIAAQGSILFAGGQPDNGDTITIPDQAVHATGSVELTAQPNDGSSVVLNDGVNPAVTFEFDSNSSVVQSATLRQVVIGASKEATAANLFTAINGAPTLAITATSLVGAKVNLRNDAAGTAGNVAITETDPGLAITPTGMSGGAANSNVKVYEFDAAVAATGTIDFTGQPVDGDTLQLNDGVNPAVTFEFDSDASVVESATLRQVVIGGSTAATVTNLINAINSAPTLGITAAPGVGDQVLVTNDVPGAAGNQAIVDATTNVTVTGLAGGANAGTVGGGNIAVTIGGTAAITAQNLADAIQGQFLLGNTQISAFRDTASATPLVRVSSTPAAGADANLTITGTGSPATLSGFTGGTNANPGTPGDSVRFFARDPGAYGNTVRVEVVYPSSVFDAPADHYDIVVSGEVDDEGVVQVLARYNNLGNEAGDGVRFVENALVDGIEGEFNPSDLLRADALAAHAPYAGTYQLGAAGTNVSAFVVGDNGTGALTAADYIGTTSGALSTGLKALRDSEQVRFNIVLVPGVSHRDVIAEVFSLVDFRKDAFALIDPPFGLLRDEVIDWHNGSNIAVPNAPVAPLQQSYAALAWPWYKQFSAYLETSLYFPPSVAVLQTFTAVDKAVGPFRASAGFVFGKFPGEELEFNPRQEDRDALLGGSNRINPLADFQSVGLIFYGNRTLLRVAGPLDSIHVVRMLIFVKRLVVDAIQTLQFAPNDPQTWRDFVQRVEPILRSVQAARGLEAFSIKCDAETNPPELRAQKTMRGIIFLQHVDAAEIIELDFALTSTGGSFSL